MPYVISKSLLKSVEKFQFPYDHIYFKEYAFEIRRILTSVNLFDDTIFRLSSLKTHFKISSKFDVKQKDFIEHFIK